MLGVLGSETAESRDVLKWADGEYDPADFLARVADAAFRHGPATARRRSAANLRLGLTPAVRRRSAQTENWRRSSLERVAHVERLELPKIAVVGVERADAVLKEDRRNVDVRDEVPANRHVAGDVLIGVDEAVLLG